MKTTLLVTIGLVALSFGFSRYHNNLGDYEKQSAADKLDHLWSLCKEEEGNPADWPSTLALLGLFTEDLWVTGEHTSDYFPDGRSKLIHSRGAIAKVEFSTEGASTDYTGIFEEGSKYGLIRASGAKAPSEGGWISDPSYTPGISLKFLRDGKPSANVFAMYELGGQKSFNFFENNFSNHVNGQDLSLSLKALQAKFETVSHSPGQVGVSELAEINESGKVVQSPNFPFALFFQPNPKLTAAFSGNKDMDIATQFPPSFNGDEELYRVYAVAGPQADEAEYVGSLKLASPFIASKFADSGMFFKHAFFEKDLIHKPEWEGNYDPTNQGWARWAHLIPNWS